MVEINFIDHTGERHQVQASVGMTVMEAAVQNRVPGIDAECGGACACATCHVYIAPEWQEAVGSAERMEEDMLDFAFDVRPNSRLSCQIKVTEALNGLVLHTPERQG
jgi:2Fe-2S ferredoxin